MANQFDSSNYPTTEPETIIAGARTAWRVPIVDTYPPDEYFLTYRLRREDSGDEIILSAIASADDYIIEIASATSASYTTGIYRFYQFITRTSDSERVLLKSGTLEILPDPTTSTADIRTHAEIMVAKIKSLLEGRADSDINEYTIENRQIVKMKSEELVRWYQFYNRLVKQERKAEKLASGMSGRRKINVRMP